jgi:hypothetical protein
VPVFGKKNNRFYLAGGPIIVLPQLQGQGRTSIRVSRRPTAGPVGHVLYVCI